MEKKKLLLVAVSVGVFLAIAISASILIITPSHNAALVASRPEAVPAGRAATAVRPVVQSANTPPATLDAVNMVRKAEELQGIQTPPAPSASSAQAVQENYFYINGEGPAESFQIERTTDNSAARVVINVPKPKTAAVPDTASPARGQAAASPAPAARPAAKPAVKAQPEAKPAAKPTAKPKPAAAPAKAVAAGNNYWVQTGAFSGKGRAETVQETLGAKGITAIIDDRSVNGKMLYRVRLGPYTSENEAKYWLSLVKAIDGFSDSQIRMSSK